MLFWLNFFTYLFIIVFLLFNLNINNFMNLILNSEILIIILFLIYVFNALLLNINWILSFSFIIIILGGLEIALGFLLLNL